MQRKQIAIVDLLQKAARFLANPFEEAVNFAGLLRLDIPAADKRAILGLSLKYKQYVETPKQTAGPTQLAPRLTEQEKEAYYLANKQRQTAAETARYRKLLREIAPLHDPLQYLAKAQAADFSGLDEYGAALVRQLIASRQAIAALDQKQTRKQAIVFVFSVYRDINRLKRPTETFTGENFLEVKCRQLAYLFHDMRYFDWRLLIAEDEACAEPDKSTVEAINRLLDNPFHLSRFAPKVQTFFPEDLLPELEQYQKRSGIFKSIFDAAEPRERARLFTEASHKGGMIHLLLRKALTYRPAAVVYTDSDTSHDLGVSGLLLKELYSGRADAVIASRRVPGAVVANKSRERELYSAGYHLLAETLFGLGIKDTQSGLKALRPQAVETVQSRLTELGMSFEVELLKLLKKDGWTIEEIPAVWRDSPYESKSSDQAQAMAAGLLRVYREIYRPETTAELPVDLPARLQAEPEYPALRRLAEDPELTAFTRNSFRLFSAVQVKDFRDFLRQAQLFIERLAYNHDAITQASLEELLAAGRRCFAILRRRKLFGFLAGNYPDLGPVLELLRKDRKYLKIIFPLFFGRNIISALLGVDGAAALQRKETLSGWLAHYAADIQAVRSFKPAPLVRQEYTPRQLERIAAAALSLRNTLPGRERPLQIGLALLHNRKIDKTALEILRTQVQDLSRYIQDLPQLQFELLIAGADKHRLTPAEEQSHLKSLNTAQIRVSYLPVSDDFEKGKFIRYTWNVLDHQRTLSATERGNAQYYAPDLLAFMDYSYKISILETLPMLAWVMENYRNPEDAVLIGSRRLDLSEVLHKSQALELRSMALNILVKSLFPKLHGVEDTQTGLKIVGRNVWHRVDATPWSADGYGWEIELLNKIAVIYDRDKEFKERVDRLAALPAKHEKLLKKLLNESFWTAENPGRAGRDALAQSVARYKKIIRDLQKETFWTTQNNMPAVDALLGQLYSAAQDYDRIIQELLEALDPAVHGPALNDLFQETSWAAETWYLIAKIKNNSALPEVIKEMPVAFDDNTSQLNITSSEQVIWNVLEEMLKILAQTADYTYYDRSNELRFIAGGADGMVFEYRNKVVKIPNENFDVDFYDVLKNLLLPGQKIMQRHEYAQRLVEHTLIDKLTAQPALDRLIPHLRAWPEANSFILRLIALLENKDFKSSGYPLAFARGQGLIIPMSRQEEPFQAVYRGRTYHFTREDNILVMAKAEVLRNRLREIIIKNDLPGFRSLLKDVTDLMRRLWRRGLFDMDTNIIADLGYYKGKLYLLDPGEIIDNPGLDILQHSKEYLTRRTDYIELRGLLSGTAQAKIMLGEYRSQMYGLFDYMLADLEQGGKYFNSDKGDFHLQNVAIIQEEYTPVTDYRGIKQHYLFLSRAGVNKRYTPFREHLPLIKAQPLADIAYLSNPGDAQVKQVLDYEALQKPFKGNVLYAERGGQGFRAGLLSLAAGGKEYIAFNGRPLIKWVMGSNAALVRELHSPDTADPLLIIASIDNYMDYRQEDIDRINQYFALPEAPGAFFYDLPAYSHAERMPETLGAMAHYFKTSKVFWRDYRYFIDSIPFIAGFARRKNNLSETILKAALTNWRAFYGSPEQARQDGGGGGMPFATQTAALLKRFILYASNQKRGIKAPYTLIFRQSFLQDLRESIGPKIPDYAGHELTWFNLLCAWKYDPALWSMLKPRLLSAAVWQDIYETMRRLAVKHHIDLSDHQQNKLRVFYGDWAALDNPFYDIVKFFKRNSARLGNTPIYVEKRFLAPRSSENEQRRENLFTPAYYARIIENCENNDVVIVGNPGYIKGRIKITAQDFRLQQSQRKTLLYEVSLPPGYVIEVPKNHMLVQLTDPDKTRHYYSMTLRPLSRTDLAKEMVYRYELAENSTTYTPRKYQPYEEFFNERFRSQR
ncbi:MAG: hypothetical protein LBQ83_07220 [Candidatus Margulisbacteria bacterium]|nr:hypothetical protein [Candidatus Margulisiibacteriota bacterium]